MAAAENIHEPARGGLAWRALFTCLASRIIP
jgi:hypothetical protein